MLATVRAGLSTEETSDLQILLAVTCELLFTLVVNTLRGPVLKASSSRFSNSSTVGWVAMLKCRRHSSYSNSSPTKPAPKKSPREHALSLYSRCWKSCRVATTCRPKVARPLKNKEAVLKSRLYCRLASQRAHLLPAWPLKASKRPSSAEASCLLCIHARICYTRMDINIL